MTFVPAPVPLAPVVLMNWSDAIGIPLHSVVSVPVGLVNSFLDVVAVYEYGSTTNRKSITDVRLAPDTVNIMYDSDHFPAGSWGKIGIATPAAAAYVATLTSGATLSMHSVTEVTSATVEEHSLTRYHHVIGGAVNVWGAKFRAGTKTKIDMLARLDGAGNSVRVVFDLTAGTYQTPIVSGTATLVGVIMSNLGGGVFLLGFSFISATSTKDSYLRFRPAIFTSTYQYAGAGELAFYVAEAQWSLRATLPDYSAVVGGTLPAYGAALIKFAEFVDVRNSASINTLERWGGVAPPPGNNVLIVYFSNPTTDAPVLVVSRLWENVDQSTPVGLTTSAFSSTPGLDSVAHFARFASFGSVLSLAFTPDFGAMVPLLSKEGFSVDAEIEQPTDSALALMVGRVRAQDAVLYSGGENTWLDLKSDPSGVSNGIGNVQLNATGTPPYKNLPGRFANDALGMIPNTTAVAHQMQFFPERIPGAEYDIEFDVKAAGGRYTYTVNVYHYPTLTYSERFAAKFNLLTGVASNAESAGGGVWISHAATPLADDWWTIRVRGKFPNDSTGRGCGFLIAIVPHLSDASSTQAWAGDNATVCLLIDEFRIKHYPTVESPYLAKFKWYNALATGSNSNKPWWCTALELRKAGGPASVIPYTQHAAEWFPQSVWPNEYFSTDAEAETGNEYPQIAAVPRRVRTRRLSAETIDVSKDGAIRVSDASEKEAYEINIEHPFINAAQVATLREFFEIWGGREVIIEDAEGRVFIGPLPRELADVAEVTGFSYTATVRFVANLQVIE